MGDIHGRGGAAAAGLFDYNVCNWLGLGDLVLTIELLLEAIANLLIQRVSQTVAILCLLDGVIEVVVALVGRELVGATVAHVKADTASILSVSMLLLVEVGHLAGDILLIGKSFILDSVLAGGVVVCLGI